MVDLVLEKSGLFAFPCKNSLQGPRRALLIGSRIGLTIDANFDYRDSIAIVEITITILSLSWHTITILSRYYRFSTKLSLKGVYLEQSRKLSPFSAVG